MTIILFILGFVLVIKGGDWFVDAASWLAELTGIPKFIVGATIVSLATTLPELMVSIMAVLNGANDMGVGNAIGSVSCNLGIGLALTIIFAPSKVNKKDFFIKGFLMLIGAVALLFSVRDNKLMPRESLLLFAILISFIILNVMAVKSVKEINVKSKKKNLKRDKLIFNIIKFIMGAAFIVFGADLMVENGEKIAHSLGIPESIIGLTLIAVGTSLPEIVTAITALIKKETSMSV
ncbi:MAG: sodium:calcium antiporter, partial [Anaerotignaceae bacterium]